MEIEPLVDPTDSVSRYMQAATEMLSFSGVRKKEGR